MLFGGGNVNTAVVYKVGNLACKKGKLVIVCGIIALGGVGKVAELFICGILYMSKGNSLIKALVGKVGIYLLFFK